MARFLCGVLIASALLCTSWIASAAGQAPTDIVPDAVMSPWAQVSDAAAALFYTALSGVTLALALAGRRLFPRLLDLATQYLDERIMTSRGARIDAAVDKAIAATTSTVTPVAIVKRIAPKAVKNAGYDDATLHDIVAARSVKK